MCVVPVRADARTAPPPGLTRLRLDGILLCEADSRCRDKHRKEARGRMSDEGTKGGRGGRPRGKRIEVWVTDQERAEIAEKADQAGLSLSGYLRAVGLNQPVRSVYDLKAVADLGRVNGDLGRVAGLLKLWLAERRGQGARPIDVEAMMNDFRALQTELSATMRRALK